MFVRIIPFPHKCLSFSPPQCKILANAPAYTDLYKCWTLDCPSLGSSLINDDRPCPCFADQAHRVLRPYTDDVWLA